MDLSQAKDLFVAHGYSLCPPLQSKLEHLPEVPGAYAVFCSSPEPHVHIVTIVPEPLLRTKVIAYLGSPAMAANSPTLIAYRAIEKFTDDDAAARHSRLVIEQAEIVEQLRKLP